MRRVTHRPHIHRIFLNAAIVLIMVAPLVAASLWIYSASAAAFRFQRDIRLAQEARNNLVRTFEATESDVRGFAATGDPYFATSYHVRVRKFASTAAVLAGDMHGLGLTGAGRLTSREQQTYSVWNRTVAAPILAGKRNATARLLRSVDPDLAAVLLADDRRAGILLDDAAAQSETRIRNLLRNILTASVGLIALVASTVVVLLLRQATAERREFKQKILYEEERRVSRMLQSALAPRHLPALANLELHAVYVPATQERQVGGDWYDAVDLRHGRMLLIIGDVAGHGLEAAVFMNRARQAILTAAVTDAEPGRILAAANRSLRGSDKMVTVACCVFDLGTMTLEYATAGHPPPVVVPSGGSAFILPNGAPPLGVVDELAVTTSRYPFAPGSLLVLYTDGLTEEFRDVIASERALAVAAERNCEAPDPASAIFSSMLSDPHPRDDVAIITLRNAQPARLARALRPSGAGVMEREA